jgi:uncharacterized protein
MHGIESLPGRFPVFPLTGALLLPGGNLPLNIFEPRYLQMVRDAMQTDGVIGMIQPSGEPGQDGRPPLYGTGCVGKINNFRETEDGRFLITLTGIARFDVAEELSVTTPYRQVMADFGRWRHDLERDPPADALRGDLLTALRGFFGLHEIEADWATIETAPLGGLVTSLAMICPFEPNEKQAVLEARDLNAQAALLTALMQMSATPGGVETSVRH